MFDPYLMLRAASRRRTTVKLRATCLRSVLRFLYITGRVILDLSSVVIGPTFAATEKWALQQFPCRHCRAETHPNPWDLALLRQNG